MNSNDKALGHLPLQTPQRSHSVFHQRLLGAMPLGVALLSLNVSPSVAQTAPTESPPSNPTPPAENTVTPPNPALSIAGQSPQPSSVAPGLTQTPTATTAGSSVTLSPTPPAAPTNQGQLQQVPIYIPVPVSSFPYPQNPYPGMPYGAGGYPLAQPTYTAAPIATPGGMTVQVTTQIGLPGAVAYPGGMPAPVPSGVAAGNLPTMQYPTTYPPVSPQPPGYGGWPLVNAAVPGMAAPDATNWLTPLSRTEAIANPALLPTPAQTLWQQVVANTTTRLNPQTLNALRQLVQLYPQFIPGHLRLAQALTTEDRTLEAIAVLEQATALYPQQPELMRSLIAALQSTNRLTEAAILARQFAAKATDSTIATEFANLATELSKAPSSPNTTAQRTLLNNVLTTGLGYLLTGKSPTATLGSTPLGSSLGTLLPGLSGVETAPTQSNLERELMRQVNLLNDLDVTNYVRDVGRKLVLASDQPNQPYEFYVVNDRDTGAVAMPGGKIFVSAGAIANANSEAALASILAKQLGHAMLSHPTRLEKRSNLTNTLSNLIPTVGSLISPRLNKNNSVLGNVAGTVASGLVGNVLSNVLKPKYTASMTREADAIAQKLLQAAGYSQNNLLNVSANSRHSEIKTKVQQLMGTSTTSWWNR